MPHLLPEPLRGIPLLQTVIQVQMVPLPSGIHRCSIGDVQNKYTVRPDIYLAYSLNIFIYKSIPPEQDRTGIPLRKHTVPDKPESAGIPAEEREQTEGEGVEAGGDMHLEVLLQERESLQASELAVIQLRLRHLPSQDRRILLPCHKPAGIGGTCKTD